jgi:Tol biopolymer transport system component
MYTQRCSLCFSISALLFLAVATLSASADLEGKIGFVASAGVNSKKFGSRDIYLMDPNGGNIELLMRTPLTDVYPTWSPNGKLVAIQDDQDNERLLYLLHLTDNRLQKLPIKVGATSMTWSPDSRYLIFNGVNPGPDPLYRILDVETGTVFDFEDLKDWKGWEPDWSPDGKHIVFNVDGDLHVGEITPDFQLIRVRKLTEGAHTFPRWSPDGERIAFYDWRENKIKIVPFAPGGRNVVRVHQTVWQFFENGQFASPPTWSPDGTHLVFAFNEAGIIPRIYLASLDGKVKKTLQDDVGWNPYWIWKSLPQAVMPLDKQFTTWGGLKRR